MRRSLIFPVETILQLEEQVKRGGETVSRSITGRVTEGSEKKEMSPTPRRRRVKKGPIRLVLFLLMGLLLSATFGPGRQIWALYREKAELEERVAALRAENMRLAEKIKEMEKISWVEQVAREELGLVKPGEIVYIPAMAGDSE